MRGALAGLFMVTAVGCLAAPATERRTPLYTAAAPVSRSQVATLDFRLPGVWWRGKPLIKSVDGQDVSTLLAPFELLPGCHVIETVTIPVHGRWTATDGDPGPNVFPLQMRAGHAYTVFEAYDTPMGPIVNVAFRTLERDPVSGQSRELAAASDATGLQSCRAQTPKS